VEGGALVAGSVPPSDTLDYTLRTMKDAEWASPPRRRAALSACDHAALCDAGAARVYQQREACKQLLGRGSEARDKEIYRE
jgi:hypothetical protein